MEKTQPVDVLETIEAVLARHRAFGDSDYIREQLHASYKRRLNKIAPHLPAAGQLLVRVVQYEDNFPFRDSLQNLNRLSLKQVSAAGA
jgi:hypothetical protein